LKNEKKSAVLTPQKVRRASFRIGNQIDTLFVGAIVSQYKILCKPPGGIEFLESTVLCKGDIGKIEPAICEKSQKSFPMAKGKACYHGLLNEIIYGVSTKITPLGGWENAAVGIPLGGFRKCKVLAIIHLSVIHSTDLPTKRKTPHCEGKAEWCFSFLLFAEFVSP
jgi:hypothetical protein